MPTRRKRISVEFYKLICHDDKFFVFERSMENRIRCVQYATAGRSQIVDIMETQDADAAHFADKRHGMLVKFNFASLRRDD